MKKRRSYWCRRCFQHFYSDKAGNHTLYCDPCGLIVKREKTKARVSKLRKRKTTPPGRDRGGGSIDEGNEMISSPAGLVKYSKSIDRVRRGREGAARRPIALLGTPYCPKKRISKVTILTIQEFTREYFK